MDAYDFAGAYAVLEDFVATLSTWYLRLAKPALWRDGLDPGEARDLYRAVRSTVQRRAGRSFRSCRRGEAITRRSGFTRSVAPRYWPARAMPVPRTTPLPRRRDRASCAASRAGSRVHVREAGRVKHRQARCAPQRSVA